VVLVRRILQPSGAYIRQEIRNVCIYSVKIRVPVWRSGGFNCGIKIRNDRSLRQVLISRQREILLNDINIIER
jgi:hypothetical protein